MACPKCGSKNTTYQMVTETKLKKKRRNIIAVILFWWWFEMIMWLFLTIPRLIVAIFAPKRNKLVNKTKSVMLCQNCGYHSA